MNGECQTEWNVVGVGGRPLAIRVKVRADIKRGGQFTDEFVMKDLTVLEFKDLYAKTAKEFFVHHGVHIVGGQAIKHAKHSQPRNLVILEGDFGSVKDHHPQDRVNQGIPHRSCSFHLIIRLWVHRRGDYLSLRPIPPSPDPLH